MKAVLFTLTALIALSSSQSMADARSIETAECRMKINGSDLRPAHFSLESLTQPKILVESGGFVMQVTPLLKNPVMNDQFEDTVNPVGLEIITANGTIAGTHNYHGGEGTTSIEAQAPLGNGELVSVQATCTVSYVE